MIVVDKKELRNKIEDIMRREFVYAILTEESLLVCAKRITNFIVEFVTAVDEED